jgi:hypothetical protein
MYNIGSGNFASSEEREINVSDRAFFRWTARSRLKQQEHTWFLDSHATDLPIYPELRVT